jgi:pimeloyl-ACP methyl ester carboxylesterase
MRLLLRESTLLTAECSINLAEGPANGPLLLLLHGFSNRWRVFLPILPSLIEKWQVVAFDFRGHGNSSRVPGGYTAAGFYRDAQAVLAHFAARSPAVLVGHSMGGSLALHLAQAQPEWVGAVVAGDSSLNTAVHVGVMNQRRQVKLFGLRRKLAGRPIDELIRRGLPPEQAEEMSQLDPHVMDYHAEGRVEGFFAGVEDVDYARLQCPVFLAQASPESGGLLQDEEIAPVLAVCPRFLFRRFACGHDLEIEKGPQAPFWQETLAFLQTLQLKPSEKAK